MQNKESTRESWASLYVKNCHLLLQFKSITYMIRDNKNNLKETRGKTTFNLHLSL